MAYPFPKVERVKDNVIRIYHPEILEPQTYLTASVAASGTALTVANNAGFSNTDPQSLILFEELGNPIAEIKRVNGSITAGTSLTSQAVTFAHAINTPLSRILFNQIEVSGASIATGSKTVIDTININVQAHWTDFVVTGTTYSFYFVRFYNSLATTPYYGSYCDAIGYADFGTNTVGFIRRMAFKNIGEEFGGRWDSDWVFDQLYLCELDILKEKDKWSQLVELDADLGNVSTGMQMISMPSDIEDTQTNKSILGLRIGTRDNMTYLDPASFQDVMESVAVTTSSVTASIGATTLTLTDSRDFEDTGSINYNGTEHSYTSNNRSTGVLSGFTAFTSQIDSGSTIWQGISFGEPRRFTVKDGVIYFDVPPSSEFEGKNIWIDYYKTVTRGDSDRDTTSFNDSGLYISWLEVAIKKEKNKGEISPTDSSLLDYTRRKALLVAKDKNPIGLRLVPQIPSFHDFRFRR